MTSVHNIGRFLAFLGFFLFSGATLAQDVEITLGPDEVAENEAWTITVTVKNERLRDYGEFPEIEGFRKRGTSSQSSTSIINGQISSSQSVTMTYMPIAQRSDREPPFTMPVNGGLMSAEGSTLRACPAALVKRSGPSRRCVDRVAVDRFWGGRDAECTGVAEHAVLAVTPGQE